MTYAAIVCFLNRFKLILRFADETGSASAVFFNTTVFKLSGKTAWEIMEKRGMNPDDYFPDELNVMVGKKALLKIYYSEYNHNKNNHRYRCDAVSQDPDVISYFQNGFIESDVRKHIMLHLLHFT